MRFDVRNSGGTKYGTVDVLHLSAFRYGTVRFVARCSGYLQLEPTVRALGFQTLDMKVSEWVERPTISESGNAYRPGRVDFCLLWDGPVEALRTLQGFEPANG